MTTTLLADKVKSCNIFTALTDWELEQLASTARIMHVDKGALLITENTESREVFMVLQGRVEVAITVPGVQQKETIAIMQRGELFGELVLLGRNRRSASATSKEECELICWNRDDLLKLFKANHHIGYQVMTQIARVLADRLYSTNMGLRTALAQSQSPV